MKRLAWLIPALLVALFSTTSIGQAATGKPFLPYEVRGQEQFLAELRACEEEGPCRLGTDIYKYFDQLHRRGLPVTVESAADLEVLIRSGEAEIKACNWNKGEVLIDYISQSNGSIGAGSARKCAQGELVLYLNGKAIVSLWCGNPINDLRQVAEAPPPAPAVPCCCLEIERVSTQYVGSRRSSIIVPAYGIIATTYVYQ